MTKLAEHDIETLEFIKDQLKEIARSAEGYTDGHDNHLQTMLMMGQMMGALVAIHQSLNAFNNNVVTLLQKENRIVLP